MAELELPILAMIGAGLMLLGLTMMALGRRRKPAADDLPVALMEALEWAQEEIEWETFPDLSKLKAAGRPVHSADVLRAVEAKRSSSMDPRTP